MAKILFYRDKCIGCGICYELQPDIWRLSKRDGRATLLKSVLKNKVFVLPVSVEIKEKTRELEKACPIRIIKLV